MASRFFPNRLASAPDPAAPGAPGADPAAALAALRRHLARVAAGRDTARNASVYTGLAGKAVTFWHVHRVGDAVAPAWRGGRDALAAEAAAAAAAALEAAGPAGRAGRHDASLLAGRAGVLAAAALAATAAGRRGDAEARAAEYAALAPAAAAAGADSEFLYGRAGYLAGAAVLNAHVAPGAVPARALVAVAGAALAEARAAVGEVCFESRVCASPLFFTWRGEPYLGAAHGAAGALHALLQLPAGMLDALPPPPRGESVREELADAVRFVLSHEVDAAGRPAPGAGGNYPTRAAHFGLLGGGGGGLLSGGGGGVREPLVHWCHGAPGMVFLFAQAAETLGPELADGGAEFRAAAERAGRATWDRGLLRKGPGACHGVAGNAYAFLRLWRATGDAAWLHKAAAFARFMETPEFEAGSRVPDHPTSLYEGEGAAACLWADLLAPETSRFPLFEV